MTKPNPADNTITYAPATQDGQLKRNTRLHITHPATLHSSSLGLLSLVTPFFHLFFLPLNTLSLVQVRSSPIYCTPSCFSSVIFAIFVSMYFLLVCLPSLPRPVVSVSCRHSFPSTFSMFQFFLLVLLFGVLLLFQHSPIFIFSFPCSVYGITLLTFSLFGIFHIPMRFLFVFL